MKSQGCFRILACTAIWIVAAPANAQFKGAGKSKAEVSLHSAAKAVVPGNAFDVGLQFTLDSDWHIYWQNSGDSGQPPKVTWTLPDGFTVGPLQFPIPKRLVSGQGVSIVTHVLEGKPMLLVEVNPPGAIADASVEIRADIRYLICHKTCLMERASVNIMLPVQTDGGEIEVAEEALFAKARRAMPKSTSKYLTVSATTNPASPTPGSTFELLLNVHLERGIHIQSNKPLSDSFIKCELFVGRTDGIEFDKPVFPDPHFRTIKFVGKVSEFAGDFTLRIPGEVYEEASPGPYKLGGIFRYQACNDRGTCFPPEAVSFATSPVGGSTGSAAPATTPTKTASANDGAPHEDASAIATSRGETDTSATEEQGLEAFLRNLGLPGMLVACFLYGLFINATPCVLPLLSIKVLGFVKQAHESRGKTLVIGLAFGLGVLMFFVILGFLAARGKNVLQNTGAVITLSAIVMVLSLSMLGVFTLQVPTVATKLDATIQQEGIVASFGKGALAPVLGFACTGPLLAGVFGWATQQPPATALLAFSVTGIGMASPYVLLGAFPNWLSFLPKPGNWMITFERLMGFLLLGMVIWLLHPVASRYGAAGLEWTLGFFVIIGLACWTIGKIDISMAFAQRWRYRGAAVGMVAGSGLLIFGWIHPLVASDAPQTHGKIAWQTWSAEAVEEAVRAGNTVFVDFTADYCTNCKVNKAVATYRPEAIEKIESLGVVAFQADFSNPDEAIFAGLQEYDRAGPPLNLVFAPGKPDKPHVMPTTFNLSELLTALDQAGPSQSQTASATQH